MIAAGSTITHLISLHINSFNNISIHVNVSRILNNMLASSNIEVIGKLMLNGILDRLHADINT